MYQYKVTIFKPMSKDVTNPYVYETIKAEDDKSAMAKAKTRVSTRIRTDESFANCKIINVKKQGEVND